MRKLKNSELKRLSIDDFKNAKKTPIIVVLDNIRSLNNIGSVFRTSDALLIEKIILCGITAQPPHKDIHKTALGATDSVEWEYIKNTIDAVNELKKNGYIVLSIEQTEKAVELQNFNIEKNKKYAVIFGNEVKGVQQKVIDLSDFSIEIPQFGTKHSFNISVSAGIVLWEFFRKFKF
ncbi:MAG: RNA methyltransferase [Bacteroidales bacterium]